MNTKRALIAIILVAVIAALPLGAYAAASHTSSTKAEVNYDLVQDQREVQAGESVSYQFSVTTEETNQVNADISIVKDYSLTPMEIKNVNFTMDGKSYEVKTLSADAFNMAYYAHIGGLKAGQHTGEIIVTYGTDGSCYLRATLSNSS